MNYILLITEKTSGHISKMIAFANICKKNNYQPFFIISNSDHEENIISKLNYKYIKYTSIFKLNYLFNKFKPLYVVSSGGRFSFPIISSSCICNCSIR